jgi:hypothetical protein
MITNRTSSNYAEALMSAAFVKPDGNDSWEAEFRLTFHAPYCVPGGHRRRGLACTDRDFGTAYGDDTPAEHQGIRGRTTGTRTP